MRYYLIAGEASGDLHGASLMRGLYARDPQADIRFWGGGLMDEVCREHRPESGLVRDYRDGAVMGYWEVLVKAFSLLRKVRECEADILRWKPDVVILIDYPGFNFRIAEFAHAKGFRVFYYIAPKVWATRERRIRKLKAWVDKLYIIFPFEKAYFSRHEVPYVYLGNPLVDAVDRSSALKESREAFLQRNALPDKPYIALLAGSRSAEIKTMMPVFRSFASRLSAIPAYAQYHFVIAAAPFRSAAEYNIKGLETRMHVVCGDTYAVLRHARAAVINSGTASLEAALIGTPQVVGYRTARLTYLIFRSTIKIKFVSLANLILDKPSFKELLQEYFTPENLVTEVRRLLEDTPYRERMLHDYAALRQQLGGGNVSEAVAASMIEELR